MGGMGWEKGAGARGGGGLGWFSGCYGGRMEGGGAERKLRPPVKNRENTGGRVCPETATLQKRESSTDESSCSVRHRCLPSLSSIPGRYHPTRAHYYPNRTSMSSQ